MQTDLKTFLRELRDVQHLDRGESVMVGLYAPQFANLPCGEVIDAAREVFAEPKEQPTKQDA